MRASGNGGQCVNTTDSAVRLTHMPTGIVIYSQTEKSSFRTRKRHSACCVPSCTTLSWKSARAPRQRSAAARSAPATVLRRYVPNFPQGRVTDHRIKLTLYKIDSIMNGDIQELLDNLIAADQAAKLARMNEAV